MGADWRERAPRSLVDPFGPRGEAIETPMDRRWLWRLEGDLAIHAPVGSHLDGLRRDLRSYLTETCEHHWLEYGESHWQNPDTGETQDIVPAHRQCLWCSEVHVLAGEP